MSDRISFSRGVHPSSHEYFNSPRPTNPERADSRRARRILNPPRDEKNEQPRVPTIVPRPTILSKPKETSISSQPAAADESEHRPNPSPSPKALSFQNAASTLTYRSSGSTIQKSAVSILAPSRTEKSAWRAQQSAPPQSPSLQSSASNTTEALPQMKAAIRLIGDSMEFTDYVQDYLSDSNTNFTVIGAIGPQGTGKSTVLSMLAGNDHQDMYRQYFFRPASREAVESCRFQSSKISILVTKSRLILLDCQAMYSSAILHDYVRCGRRGAISTENYRKVSKNAEICEGKLENQVEIESIQLISFLLQVCHTILLCVDWFVDIDVIRHMRAAEMLRSTPLPFPNATDSLRFKPNRQVNLVVIHQRAKSEDFRSSVIRQRSDHLRRLFEDSRLNVCGGVSVGSMQLDGYIAAASKISYLPLADMKPRAKSEPGQQPVTPFGDSNQLKSASVEYSVSIRNLRLQLPSLHRDSFVLGDQTITEKQWYMLASKVWRSTLNSADISKYASLMT
ncbi:hypothetical protein AB6A40_008463 [Gnathostoma spinigerum]|uniref:Protein SMG9 n=1 Tax=Gnathostoma spinigerum TaxID=75299 RepID=A0ABD6EWW3_9BILA